MSPAPLGPVRFNLLGLCSGSKCRAINQISISFSCLGDNSLGRHSSAAWLPEATNVRVPCPGIGTGDVRRRDLNDRIEEVPAQCTSFARRLVPDAARKSQRNALIKIEFDFGHVCPPFALDQNGNPMRQFCD